MSGSYGYPGRSPQDNAGGGQGDFGQDGYGSARYGRGGYGQSMPGSSGSSSYQRPASTRAQRRVGRSHRRPAPSQPNLQADSDFPKKGAKKDNSGGGNLWKELIAVVLVAALLSWTIKTFLVQPFNIPSGSMENTLLIQNRIMVSKLSPKWRKLHRGDIIVFKDPGNWLNEQETPTGVSPFGWIRDGFEFVGLAPVAKDDDLVKRLVGIPGDTVKCCDVQGKVTVNGMALQEDYLYPGDSPSLTPFQAYVPPGFLWVMGDHRSNSQDSRYHQDNPPDYGLVPLDNVVGRVFMVAFPLSEARRMKRPSTFDQPGLQPDVVSE